MGGYNQLIILILAMELNNNFRFLMQILEIQQSQRMIKIIKNDKIYHMQYYYYNIITIESFILKRYK